MMRGVRKAEVHLVMSDARASSIVKGVATCVVLSAMLSLALSALAQNEPPGAANRSSAGASADTRTERRFDTLRPDNSMRDWRRAYRDADAFAETGSVYIAGSETDWANRAQETTAGYYLPLSESLSSLIEASYLPNFAGEPEWSMLGQMGAMLGAGWGIQAGLRHSEVGLSGFDGRRWDANLGMLTLEKVWDSYRSRYTVYTSRKESGTTTSGHRVAFNYLYGTSSSIGLAYDRVWAADNPLVLPIGNGVATSNVGVSGEHWLSRMWSVNYDALFQQGNSEGLRPEFRVGLRLAF